MLPPHAHVITDTLFIAANDRALAQIGDALDAALAQRDAGVDWTVNGGVLEIECADGRKVIVNRHLANREQWVAAPSGGFHFGAHVGLWHDTRSARELGDSLAAILSAQARVAIALPMLRAP